MIVTETVLTVNEIVLVFTVLTKLQCDDDKSKKDLILTLLANGVVMKVFPQLPAFLRNENDQKTIFAPALELIADVFKDAVYREFQFDSVNNSLTIKPVQTKSTGDANSTEDLKLQTYLHTELSLLFRNHIANWEECWQTATEKGCGSEMNSAPRN